jgi:undecaprenyl-diphosphatase
MTFLQLLIIAIVQGVTEFLPISSSGHLILVPYFTQAPDQGPMIDISIHLGSLLAIIIYFWRDVSGLAKGGLATFGLADAPEQKKLLWWIAIATVPALAFGFYLKQAGWLDSFRSTTLVAINLIVYGILLGIADWLGPNRKRYEDMSPRDALIIGVAQALALIPGTSRSGITMTAGRFLGYERVEAARFSFLLAIPATAAAGLLAVMDLTEATAQVRWDAFVAGMMTFVAAFATMAFLMRFLRKASMLVFVLYRLALGAALLMFF